MFHEALGPEYFLLKVLHFSHKSVIHFDLILYKVLVWVKVHFFLYEYLTVPLPFVEKPLLILLTCSCTFAKNELWVSLWVPDALSRVYVPSSMYNLTMLMGVTIQSILIR